MKTRIRKLEEKDFKYLEHIENYKAKIVIEELQESLNKVSSENDIVQSDTYTAYGIFIGFDTLIGFCGLTHSDEYITYKNWDDTSKIITELYVLDIYTDDLEIYCDLLNCILCDKDNLHCNIYFENDINLPFEYYDQLGFIPLEEDTALVRYAINNTETEEEYK